MHHLSTVFLLAAALLTASSAHAASLTITDESLSELTSISNGFRFSYVAVGTVSQGSVTRDTDLYLDCALNTVAKSLLCTGELDYNGDVADIRMGYNDTVERFTWSIHASPSSNLTTVHELWGEQVAPQFSGVGWSSSAYYFDGHWGRWWFSTYWVDQLDAIFGNYDRDYNPYGYKPL